LRAKINLLNLDANFGPFSPTNNPVAQMTVEKTVDFPSNGVKWDVKCAWFDVEIQRK